MQIVRRRSHDLLPDGADGAASLRFLEAHLRRLRALPAHGNRVLHYDQLLVGLLLAFFNPVVRSLRLIELCGDFGGKLDPGPAGLDRMARSTTADARHGGHRSCSGGPRSSARRSLATSQAA